MMPAQVDPPPAGWNKRQRPVIFGLIAVICLIIGFHLFRTPGFVNDPQPPEGPRAGDLEDRIDPDIADWETLAALPQLGEKRARAIVAYRDQFRSEHPGQRAFQQAHDLLRIRGIGASMLVQLQPYLTFRSPAATTSPTEPRPTDH